MTGKYYSEKPQDNKEEFKTLEKLTDMIEYAYPILAQFPRSEKFVMAAEIKKIMLDALLYCIEVKKKKSKKTALLNLDIQIEALKRFIRLAHSLRFISTHHYDVWSDKAGEIGKMVGGLIAAENQNPQKS